MLLIKDATLEINSCRGVNNPEDSASNNVSMGWFIFEWIRTWRWYWSDNVACYVLMNWLLQWIKNKMNSIQLVVLLHLINVWSIFCKQLRMCEVSISTQYLFSIIELWLTNPQMLEDKILIWDDIWRIQRTHFNETFSSCVLLNLLLVVGLSLLRDYPLLQWYFHIWPLLLLSRLDEDGSTTSNIDVQRDASVVSKEHWKVCTWQLLGPFNQSEKENIRPLRRSLPELPME